MTDKDKQVVVLGGGIAGLTAALELARLGLAVALIEKNSVLGGNVARYCCQATTVCQKCGACLVVDRLEALSRQPGIKVYLRRCLTKCERHQGRMQLTLSALEQPDQTQEIFADALVVATGFAPFDPAGHLHYGVLPQVITSLELQARLKETGPPMCLDGRPALRIAFVQCVGSRDNGHPYCSRVCCGYALRLAELIKHRVPETEIAVFYMDIQNYGPNFAALYEKCRAELHLIRTLPGDVAATPEGTVRVLYMNDQGGHSEFLEVDLLVLSVGIAPGPDNPTLAATLGLELTADGFFRARDPLDRTATAAPGIFLAGTADGPKSIAETIAQATQAAYHIARFLQVIP